IIVYFDAPVSRESATLSLHDALRIFVGERDRPQGDAGASDLEFGAPGSAAGEHQRKRLIDLPQLGAETRHHLGEVAAFDLPAMTQPVHQRHRVRGGVLDMRITVEDEDAVSDPRFAVSGPA